MADKLVERLIIETDEGYIIDVSPEYTSRLVSEGYAEVKFVIEYNNDKGHYFELARLFTKDIDVDETFKEFYMRVVKRFNNYVWSTLGTNIIN